MLVYHRLLQRCDWCDGTQSDGLPTHRTGLDLVRDFDHITERRAYVLNHPPTSDVVK